MILQKNIRANSSTVVRYVHDRIHAPALLDSFAYYSAIRRVKSTRRRVLFTSVHIRVHTN